VYHGIEMLSGGGTVSIVGNASATCCTSVRNPIPAQAGYGDREGNRMALENIRQRLSGVAGARIETEQLPGSSARASSSRPMKYTRRSCLSMTSRPRGAPLRRLLAEIEDCEVIAEADGGGKRERCGELRPDVVLLDVRMPRLPARSHATSIRWKIRRR
jgi:hypothetical protein